MGTLGCISDMLRRDRENREARKRSRERLGETRRRLLETSAETRTKPGISPGHLEQIARRTQERECWERKEYFRFGLLFLGMAALLALLLWGTWCLLAA